MEILSPAGNNIHINVAIEEKSNAVYGGLKKWNARNNAVNFSIDEYNRNIKKLHENNIKFYLTLNTLMLDEEIENIITLLKSGKIELPDSFIVADIGLILRLKREFPNVDLHISTQFGAHNIEDLIFLEKLGVKRVILARELTLNEINKLKKNTTLEIETFIWGSQCLSYSGLCFFGSFINGGSGNRGKCSILCRDVYEVNSEKGTFLYVPDMNCINLTKELGKIDSLKIEGRRRTKEELQKVINEIKNKYSEDEQKGYLYGSKPEENKMYENINHRIKPIYNLKDIKEIDKKDVFIEYKHGVPYKFTNELDKENENIKYVYSEYKDSYKIEKNNIFFVLEIKDNKIVRIDYTNYKGEFKSFFINNTNDLISISIDEYINKIKKISNNINVYKVRYIRNLDNKYMISNSMLLEVLKYVEENNSIKPTTNNRKNEIQLDMIYVETDNLEVVDNLKDDKFVKIIYNLDYMENLEKIVNKYENKIIYKLPLFNWNSDNYNELYKKLYNKEVMFTRISQLEVFKNIKLKKKYIDYSIYVWNKETLNFLREYEVEEFTASPELNFEQNENIFANQKVQYILGGKLPLVYTRSCFKKVFGCQNCNIDLQKAKKIKNISKDLDFEIICKKDYRMILFNRPILNDYSKFNINKNVKFRYITYSQKPKDVKMTIDILKDSNYVEKLLKTDLWKESYENNLIVTRA